MILIC